MAIFARFDDARIRLLFGDRVVDEVAKAKVQQLERESKRNFRDDTGELRDTIRTERDGEDMLVAIGDRRRSYWQNVRKFRRGDGRTWLRRVLNTGNSAALQRAYRR